MINMHNIHKNIVIYQIKKFEDLIFNKFETFAERNDLVSQ